MKQLLLTTATLALALTAFAQTDTASEPVVIDGKRFKVMIYEKNKSIDSSQSTREIKIITHDDVDIEEEIVIEKDNKPEPPKTVVTQWNVVELGINNALHNNALEMPAGYKDMELDGAKSLNFHWGIIQQGVNIIKGKLRLVYGLGIEYNNYRFKQNIDLVKNTNPLVVNTNTTTEYAKNKLVTQYITVPLMFNYKTNPSDPDHSFNMSAGVQFGYLYGAHQKQKWDASGNEKRKVRDDFNLADYRMGYVVNFGYGGFNLYGKYYPTAMFKEGRGPALNTVAAGIVLFPF